jgi:hypothetical protein
MCKHENVAKSDDNDSVAQISLVILRKERTRHHHSRTGTPAEDARTAIRKTKRTYQHLDRASHHQGYDRKV